MKLILKGIVAREDAALAVQHGVDAVIVSNHGGHEDASARGTIECLPEVLAGVGGKIPVYIDGGFRGGADVFKALALGATAVGIGRPHIWGLAAFGQEGRGDSGSVAAARVAGHYGADRRCLDRQNSAGFADHACLKVAKMAETNESLAPQVKNNEGAHRFEAEVEGHQAILNYRPERPKAFSGAHRGSLRPLSTRVSAAA